MARATSDESGFYRRFDDPEIIGPAESREEQVRAGFWPKLRKTAGRIPFSEDAVAAYFCALDPRTPRRVRATLMATLAYFIVPTDLLPDFIAGLGFTDDAAVLAAAFRMLGQNIGEAHRVSARRALEKPDDGNHR